MDISRDPPRPGQYERRIGSRLPIAVPLAWQVPKRRSRRGRAKSRQVVTDNLSVSGAGFFDEIVEDVRIPSTIVVTIGGCEGLARICSIRPAANSGRGYYGIEFQDDGLVAAATALVTEHRRVAAEQAPPAPARPAPAPRPHFDDRGWP